MARAYLFTSPDQKAFARGRAVVESAEDIRIWHGSKLSFAIPCLALPLDGTVSTPSLYALMPA